MLGITSLLEAGHLSRLQVGDQGMQRMIMGTFYFVVDVPTLTDLVQIRYRKRLLRNYGTVVERYNWQARIE